jgi:hypothetical protein
LNTRSIRRASLETAVRLGYLTNPALPLLGVPSFWKDPSEILDRLLGMHCLAACAYGFDRQKANAWLTREIHGDVLTEPERSFLKTGLGNKQQLMVQIEGMWALAWAVGLIDSLDFGQACSPSFVTLLPNLKVAQSSTSIRTKVRGRSTEELFSACDLSYCLHWAIREAQFNNLPLPGKVSAIIILERRRALEWALSSDGWDKVSLDT